MREQPLISVIMPVYNVQAYLRPCLESILSQTLKEIEIICVNDGSTDGSVDILQEYAQKDARVVLIDRPHEGAAPARNEGIRLARGAYLSILDSDDIFLPDMLEKLYQRALATEADIVICRSCTLNTQTGQLTPTPWTLKYLPTKAIFSYKDLIPYVFDFCVGWSWDKLYRRDFVCKHRLQFQNLRSTNDAYFVFMSICLADKITVIEDVLIQHRKNSGSQLSETRDKDPLCFLKACDAIRDELQRRGLYADLEQSYLNWVINFSLWHLDTLSPQSRALVKTELEQHFFPKIGAYEKPKNYFYHPRLYARLRDLDRQKLRLWKNLFSITNSDDKKHKEIRILGCKISVKRRKK